MVGALHENSNATA
jgi:hypothetical protein